MHEKADTHVRMYVHARSFALRRALSSLCSHHLSSVAGLLSAFLLPLQGERERERERGGNIAFSRQPKRRPTTVHVIYDP